MSEFGKFLSRIFGQAMNAVNAEGFDPLNRALVEAIAKELKANPNSEGVAPKLRALGIKNINIAFGRKKERSIREHDSGADIYASDEKIVPN